MDILRPIDWNTVPIPEEIEDLDKFLQSEIIEEQKYKKYIPFVIDLLNSIDGPWNQNV